MILIWMLSAVALVSFLCGVAVGRRRSPRPLHAGQREYRVGKYITDVYHSDWSEEQLDDLYARQQEIP
jgi:hypothetical protein